jgi:methyl coenzyme M reductase alpha subunit
MKFIQRNLLRSTLAVLFIAVGASRALAYDHDSNGWYDSNHHHHPYTHHDGHRGYWDQDQTGARIFISI